MTLLPLLAALSISHAAPYFQSSTYEALKVEAAKDPAGLSKMEGAKADAAQGYTGEGVLPFHVEVLSPVELVDPVTGRRSGDKPQAVSSPSTSKEPPAGDDRPTYHFEGHSPMGGLTVYKPVRDSAGSDNSTRSSGGGLFGFLKGLFKWVAIAAGIALIVTMTPVGIGLGAALVATGAYLALKK